MTNTKTQETAYETLAREPVKWMICSYGRGEALGWEGSQTDIDRCYTLFVNFDFNDDHPREPAPLNMLGSTLGFMSITQERLGAALNRYFHWGVCKTEVPARTSWDEEKGEYNIWREPEEEQRAATLAADYTKRFIVECIHPLNFLPTRLRQSESDSEDGAQVFTSETT